MIRGNVQVRQRLLDDPARSATATASSAAIWCWSRRSSPTDWQPRRAFQGWRYLKPEDAPRDLGDRAALRELPPELRRDLADLGLL